MENYKTQNGLLRIDILGHASVVMHWNDKVIHIDPYDDVVDYGTQPQADLILITHHHHDHFDPEAIAKVRKPDSVIISTGKVARLLEGVKAICNGEEEHWEGITICAVPAYNIVNMRSPGEPFHIPGEGNGYLLTIKPLHIYVAGDTELIPAMAELGHIDIAMLPKNTPYTMNDTMFIEAARTIRPKTLYPYHYTGSGLDKALLSQALPDIRMVFTDASAHHQK